ncbi:MAG: type II toxin-antitoxin system VapC family toxin [Thermodesulfobacteriota bacterium]
MRIVADTNIFLAVALEEGSKERIVEITKGCDICAPEILFYEIGNALSAMAKRRQIGAKDVDSIYLAAQKIEVSLIKVDICKALTIAIEHNIYAYDAYFLQVAHSLASPLVTLDESLKKVARSMKIEVKE